MISPDHQYERLVLHTLTYSTPHCRGQRVHAASEDPLFLSPRVALKSRRSLHFTLQGEREVREMEKSLSEVNENTLYKLISLVSLLLRFKWIHD